MTPLQLFLSARIEMINRSAGDVDYLVTRVISRPNATKYTLGQEMTPVFFVMFLVLKSPRVKEDDLLNCLWLCYCCQGIRWFWPLEGDKLGPSPGHV